ncbi:rho GTPase-activating protein gacN-like isoform X2 [Sitophilus oryzae]|nr:rho GTPase-activating protein gacN-like isoform X2 [Sitophilus oryzae]
MNHEQNLTLEIESLKSQIENLKEAVRSLHRDTEKKEIALARIAREKEKVSLDLLRQRRSNNNLLKQLEDERKYYYHEKEQYCNEMNEYKKLKRAMSTASTHSEDGMSLEQCKRELAKAKQTLNHTLEANYNLSIKFLRMKNTKTCLKTELKTMKLEHEKLINDYKSKMESLSEELNMIINERISTPISCSSKKYLQLVKQNSCIVYENLCLQLEIDNLRLKYEKVKIEKNKTESNSKLKYANSETSNSKNFYKSTTRKQQKKVRIKDEAPEKLEKDISSIPSTSKQSTEHTSKNILKIYERNELPGIPNIEILNEREISKPRTSSEQISRQIPTVQERSCKENKHDTLIKNVLDNPGSKLTLFQVSNTASQTSTTYSGGLTRVNSSPDILLRRK